MTDYLSLPELTHRLRLLAQESGNPPPKYVVIAARVRDGAIPAVWHGGQWWVAPGHVPAVAEMFGLHPTSSAA